jgi:hypothetical protein
MAKTKTKAQKAKESLAKLKEDIAAISAEFHSDQRAYRKFYNNHADGLSGFPGIWNYVVGAAEEFHYIEMRTRQEFEWVDAVLDFADRLLSEDVFGQRDLRRLAKEVIDQRIYEGSKWTSKSMT